MTNYKKMSDQWHEWRYGDNELTEETVEEAAPRMREKPGQKELKAIKKKLEILKSIDIPSRHYSKLVSALKNAQNSIGKVEKVIQNSSKI